MTFATPDASPVIESLRTAGVTPPLRRRFAAASSERCAVPITFVSTWFSAGSPGFGVSGVRPSAPDSSRQRTDSGGSILYLARIARESAYVVGSAEQGP